VVLKLSAFSAREWYDVKYDAQIKINWLPKWSLDRWNNYLKSSPKVSIEKALCTMLPRRLVQYLLAKKEINGATHIAELSNKQQLIIQEVLFRDTIRVEGKTTHKDEFVTAGGVALKEIDFKTFRSKILPNFYLAGEVLNVDAVTGGFNFQACWTGAWHVAQDLLVKNSTQG